MQSKRITLRDVAEQAGVSRTAVSMALQHSPEISRQTGDRIRNLACEMGYRPDPQLRGMATYLRRYHREEGRGVLAFLDLRYDDPEVKEDAPDDDENIRSARQQADLMGYNVEVFYPGRDGLTDQRLSKILWARGIRGVLVGPAPFPGRRLELDWSRFAGLLLGQSVGAPLLDRIANHHFHSLVAAVHRMRELGYSRIGLALTQRMDRRTELQIHAAFLMEQDKDRRMGRIPVLIGTDAGFEKDRVLAWVRRHRPEGILLPSTSNNVVHWLQDAGFRVPQDIGVAALDLRRPDTGMSGIFQNTGGRVMYAIDHLIMKVEANRFGIPATPVTLLLESQWMDGPTTEQRKPSQQTKKSSRR